MSYRRRRDHRTPWDDAPRARHFGKAPPMPVPPPPIEFPSFDFEMPSFEMPKMPDLPPPPAPFDPEVGEAKKRRAAEQVALKDIERRRKGYSRTMLTGGAGLEDEPPVSRPSLLGR